MKEIELRQYADCSLCGEKIGASGIPMFWRVTVERFGINLKAIQRQTGLAMMLGGSAKLALVMGPDEEMTMPMMEKVTLSICENCCTVNHCVARLAELETVVKPKNSHG